MGLYVADAGVHKAAPAEVMRVAAFLDEGQRKKPVCLDTAPWVWVESRKLPPGHEPIIPRRTPFQSLGRVRCHRGRENAPEAARPRLVDSLAGRP